MKISKIEIKWAIYFALMTLVWMIAERLAGLHDQYLDYQQYLTNLFAIPAILFMVWALKDKKKNYYNGAMSYQQGLISGTLVSLFIALLSPLTQWIISYVITPDYFANVIKHTVEIGYFKTTAEAEAQFNYKNYALNSTIFAFVFGVITTAIAMLFIKTKKNL